MGKTIMVTGGTGYLGSWVVKDLLEKGYIVKVPVRDISKKSKYQFLEEIASSSSGKLEMFEADLLKDGSFDQAAKGCDAIIHMASPFTLRFKDARKDLIDPALKGTRNVLEAAGKSGTVKKVVLTSSVAAVHGDAIDMQEQGLNEFTEEQFNYSSSEKHQPYSYSKVLAEKEAWKIYDNQSSWKLVVINPSFVMGPSLTWESNSESLNLMKDLMKGKYRMGVPDITFGFVDVRDVARAHILALENEKAEGRHILAERSITLLEFAGLIEKRYGSQYKMPHGNIPKWTQYLFGWTMGFKARFIKRNVGYPIKLNSEKSRLKLGLTYIPLEKTIEDMVSQMQQSKLIS